MDDLIRKYTELIWQAATGEGIECALPKDIRDIKEVLRNFYTDSSVIIIGEFLDQPKE